MATSVVAGMLETVILALIANVATALASKGTTAAIQVGPIHGSLNEFIRAGLAVGVVRIGVQVVLSYLPSRLAADVQRDVRHRLVAAFTQASWSVQSRDREGAFQDLMTTQIVLFTDGLNQVMTTISAACMLVVFVVSALALEFWAALLLIAAGTALFAIMRPLSSVGRRQARGLSEAQVDYAAGVHEIVSVAEEANVFGAALAQQERLGALADATRNRFYTTQFLVRLVPGLYQSIVLLLLVGGLGAVSAIGTGHLASLGAVVLVLVRASSYGQQLQGGYQGLHQALPFLDRISDAEQVYRDARVARGERSLSGVSTIEFQEVSYRYEPVTPALSSVSFRVEAGEAIGVVGPTGAGKSTLVQLLLGLRRPDTGRYLIDGMEADQVSLEEWNRRVALLPQEPKLLHGTVAENIRFFRDIDQDHVESAARRAHIHEDIVTWQSGYGTVIGQRADAVSGGQRQRICLARALAGIPLVLVLDEPTSGLDPQSEVLVQQSLAELRGLVTLFVVTHRFSALSLCDRIMVVGNGRLEALAASSELMQSNEFYRTATSLSP
jgi:ABC-type multidrug transport system fused ATPase/permease subunit